MSVFNTVTTIDAATVERSDTMSRNAILAVSFGTIYAETREKTCLLYTSDAADE